MRWKPCAPRSTGREAASTRNRRRLPAWHWQRRRFNIGHSHFRERYDRAAYRSTAKAMKQLLALLAVALLAGCTLIPTQHGVAQFWGDYTNVKFQDGDVHFSADTMIRQQRRPAHWHGAVLLRVVKPLRRPSLALESAERWYQGPCRASYTGSHNRQNQLHRLCRSRSSLGACSGLPHQRQQPFTANDLSPPRKKEPHRPQSPRTSSFSRYRSATPLSATSGKVRHNPAQESALGDAW